MITIKLDEVDVMLLMDIFPTADVFMQANKSGDVKFPIVSPSDFSWASRQYNATAEEW